MTTCESNYSEVDVTGLYEPTSERERLRAIWGLGIDIDSEYVLDSMTGDQPANERS